MELAVLKQHAREAGFDACGAAPCRPMPVEMSRVEAWIRQDLHAGMRFMENHPDLRRDPAMLYPGARSVIVCLMRYPADSGYVPGTPRIAAYARFPDYHYIIKERLAELLVRIRQLDPGCDGRAFVDSGPLLEKSWAVEAGLGWQGRHSLLIHPEFGSFCFIGIILTTLQLNTYDVPYAENRCGSCRRCIESCPTGAIPERGPIDCRRCLSYQTIENRGAIPGEWVPALGDRLFGCDTCQDVCPWNKCTTLSGHSFFRVEEGLYRVTEQEWLTMGTGEFRRRFGHTPLARAGLKKIKQTLSQKTTI
jgi:epoxyqueuosine reductase